MHELKRQIDLGTAFEASSNPYMVLTPDLRYAAMNQAYLDATASRRDALIGKPVFQAFDGGPGDEGQASMHQLRASLEKVLATRERDHLALIHYAIPVTSSDGKSVFEDRYWSATHTPLLNDDGDVIYILQHTSDVTELQRLRQKFDVDDSAGPISALDAIIGGNVLKRASEVQADNRRLEIERNRLVEMFMQAPGFVAVLSGPNHNFQLYNEAYHRLVDHRDLKGKTVAEALPEVVEQGYIDMLDSVFQTGEPLHGKDKLFQIRRRPGLPMESAYVDFIYQPVRDEGGQVVGIFVQGYDVTENVIAAERQKLMIDELNHRVKNTLATVQSIAMQTARSHIDPATFAKGFQARLMALSHTHDLLTRSHWEGADLADILEHETAAHGANRVIQNGPALALEPAAALSIGMIFHELATNAAKYGALSVGDGRVFVDWSVGNQQDRRLHLTWREVGGPAVMEPERKGFGSRLIERNVRHDLAGEAKLSYATNGFQAEISIPLDRGRIA